ncbi:MAG: hypothetical protein ACR2QH_17050 [Geminicoccaceae bacterium]
MKHENSTFLCGAAETVELFFFAKELDSLVEKETENSSFFVRFQDQWYKYSYSSGWPAISMAVIKPLNQDRTVVAVAQTGEYWEVKTKSLQETHGEIGGVVESIRALTSLDDIIFACGMGRTVLRRESPGTWVEIGPGMSPDDSQNVAGFEDIGGFSSQDMYAVGWLGEIWQYTNLQWQQLVSPVSANLNAVCCADDGLVYVVGDDGIMLRGRDSLWEIIETGRTDNLMDVAAYDGTVYVSTDFEILKLIDDSLVAEDAFLEPDDAPETCLHLLEAKDGLVSIGTKDVTVLVGGSWMRLV